MCMGQSDFCIVRQGYLYDLLPKFNFQHKTRPFPFWEYGMDSLKSLKYRAFLKFKIIILHNQVTDNATNTVVIFLWEMKRRLEAFFPLHHDVFLLHVSSSVIVDIIVLQCATVREMPESIKVIDKLRGVWF